MLKELGYRKGVNLGGWMSQCDYSRERLDTFVTEEDFVRIAEWGFDHVRLPVDYNVIQREDGSMIGEGLERIDRAMEWAGKNSLRVVVDLHKTRGFSFSPGEGESGFFENEKSQAFFHAVWEEFAARYGSMGGKVMFDLLNEVTGKEFLEPWIRISRETVGRIRRSAPDVPVLLGSYWWNSAKTVPELPAPYDGNVVYSFHFYEPHDFTHQGAPWEAASRDISRRYTYRESGSSVRYMEDFILPAVRKAEAEGTELYCGEYGVIDVVPPEEALKWFRDLGTVFEEYGIARALWSWRQMSFGLTDRRLDAVRKEMLALL